jgi:hypothetical protein
MAYRDYYSSGGPTHSYYTLSLVNPARDDATDEFPVVYNETRNSPFLNDPQSYYASIVRFSCTTPLLPILIPAMKDTVTNQTHYSVTMHHPGLNGGVPVRQYVYYQSSTPFLPKTAVEYYYIYQPIQFINMVNQALAICWEGLGTGISQDPPFIAWNNDTSIGDMYVPKDFCRTPFPQSSVNYPSGFYPPSAASSALSAEPCGEPLGAGFENLRITLAAGQGARYLVGDRINLSTQFGSNAQPSPFPPVQIVSITGDIVTVGPRGAPPNPLNAYTNVAVAVGATISANTPIGIYMNSGLYNLFSSFAAENQASLVTPVPPQGTHWRLQFAPTYGEILNGEYPNPTTPGNLSYADYGNDPTPPTAIARIASTQQYSSVPLWNPVSSFVFTTSILPITPENLSVPFLATGALNNGGNNSAIGTVLTDFEIPLTTGYETKPTINYTPSAEYRLVDLNGNSPQSSIQISIGWRDKSGVNRPLNIGPNGFAQVKMLFRKKDFDGV